MQREQKKRKLFKRFLRKSYKSRDFFCPKKEDLDFFRETPIGNLRVLCCPYQQRSRRCARKKITFSPVDKKMNQRA